MNLKLSTWILIGGGVVAILEIFPSVLGNNKFSTSVQNNLENAESHLPFGSHLWPYVLAVGAFGKFTGKF